MTFDYSKPLTIEGLHNLYKTLTTDEVMTFTQSFLDYAIRCDQGYNTAFDLGILASAFKISVDIFKINNAYPLARIGEEFVEMFNSFEGLVEFCMDSINEAQPEPTITLQ